MSIKVSVIIPLYNEADNINILVSALNAFFSENGTYKCEIIFVNDGSSDNSFELLKNASHRHYQFKLISFSKNFGSHAALRAGILHATGDYITFMYADLQDPLELINKLLVECTTNKNEIAWACRSNTGNKFSERAFSKAYSLLMRKYAIASYPEKGFDIVMFSKKVQLYVNQNIEANSSIFLQILTLGFKQSSIQYNKQVRKVGKSKWTLGKKIKLFVDSFVAFSYMPIRFVTYIGILLFVLGLMWSGYLVFRKLFIGDLISGWPTLMSILLLGFGITNISLGIIAEYLWRTLDTSRKRPVFIIDELVE